MISEHASPLAGLGGADSGGQNVYVAQVARHLAAAGHAVDVFTRRDHRDQPPILEWAPGVRIVHVPAGPPVRLRKEDLLPVMGEFTSFFLHHCRKRRVPYQVIHAHFFMSALVAVDAKRVLGIPVVVMFHALGRVRRIYQGDADGFPEERLAIEERAVAEADRIIAECAQDEEDLIRLYGVEAARITLIPCGFDPEEMGPVSESRARAALGIGPDEKIVLQLGRMVPRKGIETVVRGVARLRHDYGVPARLLVVGGESRDPSPVLTPEIGRLQEIAAEEDVADAVTFVGSRGRRELRNFYCAADVFVTTPWYEPFGITPVEAMACGTPVIGSAVGGIQYTIRDGETGFLIPPQDPRALARRLRDLFQQPRLLRDMGRNAIRRANSLFTWKRVAAMIGELYHEVALSGPAPESRTRRRASVREAALRVCARR